MDAGWSLSLSLSIDAECGRRETTTLNGGQDAFPTIRTGIAPVGTEILVNGTIVAPMGFDWKIGTALVGAFAAKEVFVAQLGIVYSVGSPDETGAAHLRKRLRADCSPLVGFCIMLFALIASPCMATVAVIRRESGSWGWATFQFIGLSILAWIVTVIVYQTGTLLELGV